MIHFTLAVAVGREIRFAWRQFVWTKVHTTDASTHCCATDVRKMEVNHVVC